MHTIDLQTCYCSCFINFFNPRSLILDRSFPRNPHMLYVDRNLKSLETIVNNELSNVYDWLTWLTPNKLSLNIKKSNFVVLQRRQKTLNYEVNLKVFDYHTNTHISLERKNYVKYLDALIDENLSWKYHTVHFASKTSKTTGIIAR